MKGGIVVYSYYSPEEITGIGKYNGELIRYLIDKEFDVISISNIPFYPHWKKYDGFKNRLYKSSIEKNHHDIRTWVYIPQNPTAIRKIISEVSFLLSSVVGFLVNLRAIRRSKLILVLNPPFFLSLVPLLLCGNKKLFLHVQDLQIDAAKELGLLPRFICTKLEFLERFLMKKAKYVSTISAGMRSKLLAKNLGKEILLVPNWSDLRIIKPTSVKNWLHDHLNLDWSKKLIVYSGNIGQKQGLEVVVDAAKHLEQRKDLHFVILGEGLYKMQLIQLIESRKIENITVDSLVQKRDLNQMLNSSFIQLVIQKGDSTESFLPSKLTNILAAGCASIVTARAETTLYKLLKPEMSAILVEPDSYIALSAAILQLTDNNVLRDEVKISARKWAMMNLDIKNCLDPLNEIIS